jgi:diguanylate cyclase
MTRRAADLKRSKALAETSLRRITALKAGADPKSYAVWYSVAAGDNGSLRHAVDQLIARKRSLSHQDIQNLHDAHVAPSLGSEKLGQVGAQIADEIDQIAAMVAAAQEVAATYSQRIGDVTRTLGAVRDRDGVHAIIRNLLAVTRDMEADNVTLRTQLKSTLRDVADLRGALEGARRDSLTDPLTSLGNRSYFDQSLAVAVEKCHARREPLSLLLIGIDHFTRVNDLHGQLIGDRVLRFVAMTLQRMVKDEDIVARTGGDEFGVVLSKSRLSAAVKLGQQMRAAIMSKDLLKHLTHGKRTPLTVSIGVAALDRGGTARALTEAADMCLFAAKRAGRNRLIAETDEELFEAVTS